MIIKNGRVALPGEKVFKVVDIRIEREQIVEIGANLSGNKNIIDAKGIIVLPGGIDPHVHFDEPGYTYREDFYHGSCAAASGGITTVIDMPCTSIPPVINKVNLQKKLDVIEKKSVIDFGLYGGVSAQSFEEGFPGYMEELAGSVLGLKTYFTSGMESFKQLNFYQFRRVLQEAKKLGLPVLLHAEDYNYVKTATESLITKGNQPIHYYKSRPEVAEISAVLTAVELAEEVNAELHIVHIGTAKAGEILKGSKITGETAPHYLQFDVRDFERIGSPLKVTPPVKSSENRDGLWRLLADGVINFVASDHAPCALEEKNTGSIWTDYSGIPGSGTLLPYMFSEGFMKGKITLKRLIEVTSENAAKRYGIFHKKGSIELGKDADFVFIDPDKNWVVEGKKFYSKGKVTPFEGMEFKGRVSKTILRGKIIYDSETGIMVDGGYGKFLKPQASGHHAKGGVVRSDKIIRKLL